MNARARIEDLRRLSRALFGVAAVAAAVGLTACGSSDGSVGVGSGQDPDPVALDFPIAYTKGPLRDANMQLQSPTDIRDVQRFNVGTDLYLLDRASPSAVERNITFSETLGLGDVQGVEISADGTRVLFAMRGPFDPNLAAEDQPTWNIWEYDIPTDTLRRIIPDDLTAEEGHDIDPQYLADGRIIFSSTRQTQSKAILVDENKQQFEAFDESFGEPSFVLHVMDDDGNNIHQVSFNQSHDLDPTLRENGKVVFTRWDNAGNNNAMHLYQMNPDGSALELLYGAESHQTGPNGDTIQFVGAREMRDGRIMAIAREFDHPELGGDVITIDIGTFVENTQPVALFFGMAGPAQASATPNQVRTDLLPSVGGRFSSAFPLWDGTDRVLVAWEICRLVEDPAAATPIIVPCTPQNLAIPTAVPADPLYGIWMYDPIDQTQLPVVVGEEGVLIADVAAAQPRPNPLAIPDPVPGIDVDPDLVADNVGILNIRSVYDVDGTDIATPDIATLADPAFATADERPRRFVRIEKAVSIPDPDIKDLDATDFGPNILQGMREIVGYAPVEPDGSVRVKVPANVALAVSVLDQNGRRVTARHQAWIQLVPGQELRCNGCHSPFSGMSHGRGESFDSAYSGATGDGVAFTNTLASLSPNFGETMAETRTRISCQTDCAALEPSLDINYEDYWTDPAVRTPDSPFWYRYSDITTLAQLPVTNPACLSTWSATCRSVINYETHIHPLWSANRQILDGMGNVVEDHTCTQGGCHIPRDAMDQVALPAAQLDLSDIVPREVADHATAYQELLFSDAEQEVVGGALQDVAGGMTIPASMSAAGANASNRFFSEFDAGGTHFGFLSPAELKLIAEWLDIGAQYYNNPFDVPDN
jgi:Hydrazine synthase alpha subunit middle domain